MAKGHKTTGSEAHPIPCCIATLCLQRARAASGVPCRSLHAPGADSWKQQRGVLEPAGASPAAPAPPHRRTHRRRCCAAASSSHDSSQQEEDSTTTTTATTTGEPSSPRDDGQAPASNHPSHQGSDREPSDSQNPQRHRPRAPTPYSQQPLGSEWEDGGGGLSYVHVSHGDDGGEYEDEYTEDMSVSVGVRMRACVRVTVCVCRYVLMLSAVLCVLILLPLLAYHAWSSKATIRRKHNQIRISDSKIVIRHAGTPCLVPT